MPLLPTSTALHSSVQGELRKRVLPPPLPRGASRYNEAKEGGASESELDALRTQLLETQYIIHPVQRMIILNDLEPLRHKILMR